MYCLESSDNNGAEFEPINLNKTPRVFTFKSRKSTTSVSRSDDRPSTTVEVRDIQDESTLLVQDNPPNPDEESRSKVNEKSTTSKEASEEVWHAEEVKKSTEGEQPDAARKTSKITSKYASDYEVGEPSTLMTTDFSTAQNCEAPDITESDKEMATYAAAYDNADCKSKDGDSSILSNITNKGIAAVRPKNVTILGKSSKGGQRCKLSKNKSGGKLLPARLATSEYT